MIINPQRPIRVFCLEDLWHSLFHSGPRNIIIYLSISGAERSLACFTRGIEYQPHPSQSFLALYALNYPTSVHFCSFFLYLEWPKERERAMGHFFAMSTCMAHIARLINLFSSFGCLVGPLFSVLSLWPSLSAEKECKLECEPIFSYSFFLTPCTIVCIDTYTLLTLLTTLSSEMAWSSGWANSVLTARSCALCTIDIHVMVLEYILYFCHLLSIEYTLTLYHTWDESMGVKRVSNCMTNGERDGWWMLPCPALSCPVLN